ncbi:GumC domain-containing protein [Mucilaginibacter pedocola]|uniref:Lipopolysaccharide biosynthesis protein n=1 Tax=Mucilaginibacter pedocola TaxID=1792845 RepID=A0A1S9PF00_9SPHI|nr:Wzz/FepE/Etk N-terminal domain-containing protein [Mucilaginibacter pedocola]OOQ59479.1 lipopolysaccharide biosynthesis protein [Mucilaginibacter pedocola]
MQEKVQNNKAENQDEVSLKELIGSLKTDVAYLRSKWMLIMAVGVVCCLIGLGYSFYKKPIYVATSTFVLEEGNKMGGLSQYAGLASLAGIDLGKDGGGIFQGDNILELYRSRVMLEKTLLAKVNIGGKQQLLIDRYVNFNELREKWRKKNDIDSITFDGPPANFNRTQDSLITDIVETFNKKVLSVNKPDKKLSIIKVEVATTDEAFAKEFNIKLVETVNDFYTQTKTKKSGQNVMLLQKQADSVKAVLNQSLSGVASAIDAAPNANPGMTSLRVPSQRRQVDVQASTAIYSEIVKNLEVSKISLRQDTPLIQLIDEPVLPLAVNKLGKIKGLAIGFIAGIFITAAGLVFRRIAKRIMA